MGNIFACATPSAFQHNVPCPQDIDVQIKVSSRPLSSDGLFSPTTKPGFLREAVSVALAYVRHAFEDLIDEFSGTSIVLSEMEEAWIHDTLAEIDSARARRLAVARKYGRVAADDAAAPSFLGPTDVVVSMVHDSATKTEFVGKLSKVVHACQEVGDEDDDDSASCTTETTDPMSDVDAYGSDADEPLGSDTEEDSFLAAEADADTDADADADAGSASQADRLLRLASSSVDVDAVVYVDDYLCPCGECPHLQQIKQDVETVVTWRSALDRGSVARVLSAFATYNEVIGYRREMVATADECLQIWCGDEDRALTSLVRLYDQLPMCVAG
ncbi:hypothetical protein ATCC90586_012073 [Pythium insidiosum]|nr:hypothetical protein ATCC90586_012073 [Pythium insidiosum]